MEIARINYYNEYSNQTADVAAKIDNTEERVSNVSEKIDDMDRKTSKLQTDFVTILSIFAAIVITFSTGSNYISSALSSISDTPLFYALLAFLVCGVVLVNAISVLLYAVGEIIDRREPNGRWTEQLKNRMPYVYSINKFLIAGIVIVLVLWILGSLNVLHFMDGIMF